MRSISNVGRDSSCRILFKTFNILPLPFMYIMETVYYIKMNIGGLEQNSVWHIIIHVKDRIFHLSYVGLIFFKKV